MSTALFQRRFYRSKRILRFTDRIGKIGIFPVLFLFLTCIVVGLREGSKLGGLFLHFFIPLIERLLFQGKVVPRLGEFCFGFVPVFFLYLFIFNLILQVRYHQLPFFFSGGECLGGRLILSLGLRKFFPTQCEGRFCIFKGFNQRHFPGECFF